MGAFRRPVRYLREQRPGLNRARSRGAREARGEIVLYTDDDVRPDPNWITAMLEPFSNPRVAAVTGLVMPLELESRAQFLFEAYGGFGRGFERRVFDYTNLAPSAAGVAGAGASMAFRRDLLVGMGLFEAELDAGTVTETGGDSYAFYQLLAEGFQIVYNPEALVWHRHRRELDDLRATLASYSVGGFAFLTRCLLEHGDWQAMAIALEWLLSDHLPQLGRSLFGWIRPNVDRPDRLPLSLVLPQFAGIIRGIRAHFVARRIESRSGAGLERVEQALDPPPDPIANPPPEPYSDQVAGPLAGRQAERPAGRSPR
jgi:glycosyltransferase involved in cell wall biosynthesis